VKKLLGFFSFLLFFFFLNPTIHFCVKFGTNIKNQMQREFLLQISFFWGKITTFPLIFKEGGGGYFVPIFFGIGF
jgi:hypothetical protein